MCGITLIHLNKDNLLSSNYINEFTKSLIHRGPDGINHFNDYEKNLSIGHTRLKIIDISSSANQPFFDKDKRYVLSYNGEIFNYLELREILKQKGYYFRTNSDTEVLLTSFIEWGENCLYKFNGFWSFIVYDRLKKNIFISRDRFGVKPLYYLYTNKYFIVSSELKAFKNINEIINIDPNYTELLKLRKGSICEETYIKNIKSLLPGHNIKYDFINFKLNRWWDTSDYIDDNFKKSDFQDQFNYLFTDSCRLRLRSDVPLTTSLSGGLDSSSVVAEINQKYNKIKKHESYFVNYNYDESINVNKLKNKYKLTIKEIIFNEKIITLENLKNSTLSQEIIGDDAIGPWEVYKRMSTDGFKVSIDGHGPDELMGGYVTKKDSIITRVINRILIKSNDSNKNYFTTEILNHNDVEFNIPEHFDSFDRLLYYDFHRGSLPIILEKFDKISMAHGIESREPFLDWRLVCLLFSMPSNLKINKKNISKLVLRRSMKGKLPNSINNSYNKKGFNQDNDKFSQTYKKLFDEIVFSKNFKEDDLFNHSEIQRDIKSNNMNYKKLLRYIQVFYLKNNLC